MKDLPLPITSKKLVPQFVGPFEINPVGVLFRLPASMTVHPTFHGSRVKLVTESGFSPPAGDPPPARVIDGVAAYTGRRIMDVCRH